MSKARRTGWPWRKRVVGADARAESGCPAKVSQSRLSDPIGSSMSMTAGKPVALGAAP